MGRFRCGQAFVTYDMTVDNQIAFLSLSLPRSGIIRGLLQRTLAKQQRGFKRRENMTG
jgi:hypothetical protein